MVDLLDIRHSGVHGTSPRVASDAGTSGRYRRIGHVLLQLAFIFIMGAGLAEFVMFVVLGYMGVHN